MYLQTVKIIISYEGGERVNHAILMSSGAENIDFMIHGIVQYEIFGHKVWITTSHVCILIVMLLMMALAIAGCLGFLANAGEIIAWFQLISMPLKLASSLQNFLLLSIPLFILAAKTARYCST